MSVSLIGLTANFFFERDFLQKWSTIKKKKYLPIVFSGLFLAELLWLPFSEDIFIGLKSFNDAAVFVTSPKPEKEEWKNKK